MSSPDRMEMHARAIADLVQAMSRMEAEQQSHDRHLQVIEEWMGRHEEWMQSHNDWMERHNEWGQSHNDWMERHNEWGQSHNDWMERHNEWGQDIQTESKENRARISEIIGELTDMQADIARLDAAS